MQQSSSGSYLDGIPGWQRLGRVDIHSRRPMEAVPPVCELGVHLLLARLMRFECSLLGGMHAGRVHAAVQRVRSLLHHSEQEVYSRPIGSVRMARSLANFPSVPLP